MVVRRSSRSFKWSLITTPSCLGQGPQEYGGQRLWDGDLPCFAERKGRSCSARCFEHLGTAWSVSVKTAFCNPHLIIKDACQTARGSFMVFLSAVRISASIPRPREWNPKRLPENVQELLKARESSQLCSLKIWTLPIDHSLLLSYTDTLRISRMWIEVFLDLLEPQAGDLASSRRKFTVIWNVPRSHLFNSKWTSTPLPDGRFFQTQARRQGGKRCICQYDICFVVGMASHCCRKIWAQ